MASTTNKAKNPLEYYTENMANYENEQNKAIQNKYGVNAQNNVNFNASQGIQQTNLNPNASYNANPYQQQIDLSNFKNSQKNQALTQSALDMYKQVVNQNYSAKQEAEVQKETAQLYTQNQLQNQGLGNQGIAESTQAKLYNNYANQVGNANAQKNAYSNDIMSQYQQNINANNSANMDLNYEMQNAMYEENTNNYVNDLGKYVAYDDTGNITANNFKSLEEIDNLYGQYKGQLGSNEQKAQQDILSLKQDYLTKNYGIDTNTPLNINGAIVQYARNNQVKDGDMFKVEGKNYVYFNNKIYATSKTPSGVKTIDLTNTHTPKTAHQYVEDYNKSQGNAQANSSSNGR
jgi:hypothetical protein